MDRWRAAALAAAMISVAGCGGGAQPADEPAQATPVQGRGQVSAPAATTTTLQDGDFSIDVPSGYALDQHDGVHIMRNGDASISFSRTATDTPADGYGFELAAQLGGRTLITQPSQDAFVAELKRGPAHELIVVQRDGDALAVTTGHSPDAGTLTLDDVRAAAASAQGGATLQPPKAGPSTIELEPYQSPDGGASGLVPSGPDWTISSNQGDIEGSGPKGAFLFGFSYNPILPSNAPAGSPGVVSDYLQAGDALATVIPALSPSIQNVQITQTVQDAVLPSFTSSAMYAYDFTLNGEPWTGVATVGTDDPSKYSNFVWGFYYSGISVPKGSDPAVGAGLLKAWQAWNPSGAIAQRTQQAKQLLDETNQVWQDTEEFRARAADRQSRDVGCLLQGYYDVEDNSRKYDLPPLPCDQQYVP